MALKDGKAAGRAGLRGLREGFGMPPASLRTLRGLKRPSRLRIASDGFVGFGREGLGQGSPRRCGRCVWATVRTVSGA